MKNKKTKTTYRLRHWKDYNTALRQRGSLTVWFSEDILSQWQNPKRNGQRGKPRFYTDALILCLATLGEVDHLPLRATEGLLRSLVSWMGLALPVPDYTTLCRRRKQREVELPRSQKVVTTHSVSDGEV
jgi:hypothetical protein